MPEESLREIAATNEPPHTLASPEFFFLLQRIDRLDEKLTKEIRDGDHRSEERINTLEQRIDTVEQKLTQRIDAVEQKLTQRIDKLDDKLANLRFWAIGAVITIAVGFIGTIATLLYK